MSYISLCMSSLQRVLHSVLSARVLLHMREAAANPNGLASHHVSTVTGMSVGPDSHVRIEGPASYFMGPEDLGYPMDTLRDLRTPHTPTGHQRRGVPFKEDDDDYDWEGFER